MELLECVLLVTDGNEASGAVADHDGVAVIDDVLRIYKLAKQIAGGASEMMVTKPQSTAACEC